MCRARSGEVPLPLNRPKAPGGPQPSAWPQHKALLSKPVVLIEADRIPNVWRLLSGPNSLFANRCIRPRCGGPNFGQLHRCNFAGTILSGGLSIFENGL